MLRQIVEELIDLYNVWGGLMFSLQFLAYVAYLNSTYVPTSSNAIAYCLQLLFFLAVNFVVSALEGAIISVVLTPVERLLSWLSSI